MLRVVVSKSAAGALKYFTEGLAREDYYAEGQEVVGKWRGKAAKLLGLSGAVTREEFAALAHNRHPETGAKLTPRTKADRRVGYDFTFNSPKSLSLLHALSGDERIVGAFRAAVAETMREIEALTTTRVRKGGAKSERVTGNLAWAEFVHFTARPVDGIPDPHLHVHAYAHNLTFDAVEDRWKAASWRDIKSDAPYCQAVFHSRLAEKIVGLGYGVERTPDGWEVAGIPRSLIENFSRRTAQIEKIAQEKGVTNAKAKDKLGAATREGKRRGISKEDLFATWKARLSPDEASLFENLAAQRVPRALTGRITPALSLDEACEKLFAKDSVVEVKRLVAEALRFGVGHVSPESVWSEFQRRGMIVKTIGREMLCTSIEVLAEEVELINFVRSGRGKCAALQAGALKFASEKLSAEQKAAVRHVLKSHDQVVGIRGAAGTGKTTVMREVVNQIEAQGIRVFAFAPSASASRETLREAGFANAETVAHLLMNKKLQAATRGQVIWVDEAGLLGVRDMLALTRILGSSTRLLPTGDIAQHAPVARGDGLRLLQRYAGLRVAELTEIRRQEREDYRKAVAALSTGDLRTAFRRLDEMEAIIEVENDAERYRMLANDYLALSRGRSIPLVVSPTHAEGAATTIAIRAARAEAGQLGKEWKFTRYQNQRWEDPDKRRAENYREGLVVQFHQNAKGILRGSVFHVIRISDTGEVFARTADGIEIALPLQMAARFQVYEPEEIMLARGDRIRITANGKSEDGRRLNNGNLFTIEKFARDGSIVLNTGAILNPVHGHLTYGYVQTSHSAQGKTVRDVLVAQSAASFFSSSTEQLYVSVSRAKESIRIYTDDRRELERAVGYTSTRRGGVELAGLTAKEVAGLMNAELDGKQWRDLIQSRRAGNETQSHVQNLLRERRQDGLKKPENMDFRQYIAMRRALAGADGKSRSKGHPAGSGKKPEIALRGRSFLRPTQPQHPAGDKKPAANENRKAPVPPRQKLAARAFAAAKEHFKKIGERTKTAVNSWKQPEKAKPISKTRLNAITKHRAKNQSGGDSAKVKSKTKQQVKAPTPPPPVRRR